MHEETHKADPAEELARVIREEVSKAEEQELNQARNRGTRISLRGKHPEGRFPSHFAIIRERDHDKVLEEVEKLVNVLMKKHGGRKWNKRLQDGELDSLPHAGEKQVRMERFIWQLKGWEGSFYGTDLTGKPACEVRDFFRKEIFPRWKVLPSQTDLPEYDPDSINNKMLKTCEALSEALEDSISQDFLPFLDHVRKYGPLGPPFTIGLKESSEDPEEAQKRDSDPETEP